MVPSEIEQAGLLICEWNYMRQKVIYFMIVFISTRVSKEVLRFYSEVINCIYLIKCKK